MPPPNKHSRGGGSSNNTRSKPSKKQQPAQPSLPETYSDCIDEALALEDQGDRYASGPKSWRFYTRASELYARAETLAAGSNSNDEFDIRGMHYNRGRILLLLAEFSDPMPTPKERRRLLEEAVMQFRTSMSVPVKSGQDAEELNVDAVFNLAQALRSVAEVAAEDGEGDRVTSVRGLMEADELLEGVYRVQERMWVKRVEAAGGMDWLRGTLGEKGKGKTSTTTTTSPMTLCSPPPPSSSTTTPKSDNNEEEDACTLVVLLDTLTTHAQLLTTLSQDLPSTSTPPTPHDRSLLKLAQASSLLDHIDSARQDPALTPSLLSTLIGMNEQEQTKYAQDIQIRHAEAVASRAESVLMEEARVDDALFSDAVGRLEQLGEAHLEALCGRGDILVSWASALKKVSGSPQELPLTTSSGSSMQIDNTDSVTPRLTQLYERAEYAFATALRLAPPTSETAATIAHSLADTFLLRIPLSVSPHTLAASSEPHYRSSIHLIQSRIKAARDEGDMTLLGTLLGKLAKALSWQAKEEECRKVVEAWKKRGLVGCEGDETGVGFAPCTKGWGWFDLW
ncbi:hypothetical protein DFS34DRAFT_697469 [Phlyctochytrium arcticum]|nr:hypothetical protein DFS34DRAFT_697469 [Phlyctochytrium arcticum]